jgi:hypothetical protein
MAQNIDGEHGKSGDAVLRLRRDREAPQGCSSGSPMFVGNIKDG